MATGARSWSTTAATNATADSNVNFAEGMAPSAVNDSARALMASFAKYREDNNGTVTTGGTSTAYTATSNQGLALTDGVSITLKMSATNGTSPTLNVDSLGAKAIQAISGTAIGSGILKSGAQYTYVYRSSPDAWIVQNNPSVEFGSGTAMVFYQDSAPTGWSIVTTNTDDTALRIVKGSGNGGGTGGATGGSTAFSTVFAARTIAALNLPNVTITVTDPGHTHTLSFSAGAIGLVSGSNIQTGGGGTLNTQNIAGTATSHTTGITAAIDSTARGGAQTSMDFATKYVSCVVATKA